MVRVDVASTVNYLFTLYASGHANETEVRDALYTACLEVVSAMHPELTQEEVKKKSGIMAEEFLRAFKLESTSKRMMSVFRGKLRL
jgi:hypothetical protein